jgi:alpha-1,6-mannosyltransferase
VSQFWKLGGPRLGLTLAAGLLAAWVVDTLRSPPGSDIPRYVGVFLAAWLVYVVAIRLVLALSTKQVGRDLAGIFLVGLALRAAMLLGPPTLSDDVFRSIWDARVLHAGLNPYAFPPAAEELATLRDSEFWPRVNAREQRTPYPPATEIVGAAAYKLAPEQPVTFQVLAAGFDLLGAALLGWLLHRLGSDPRRAIVMAWSPMALIHFAHSGHNDSVMTAAIIGAGLLLTFGQRSWAMAALGIATMVKVVPVVTVPAFLRRAGFVGAVVWLSTCVLVLVPFASSGASAVTGLLEEGRDARFNESVRWLLDRLLGAAFGDSGQILASGLVASALVLGAVALARQSMSAETAFVAGLRALGLYLLLSAVVQPWYTTWLAALGALRLRAKGRGLFAANEGAAWLWLGGVSAFTELTYWPGFEGAWPAIRAVEYIPVYGVLAWMLFERRAKK